MFAEGLSLKAMVTAATLGVSLGDAVPAEACGASREGMDAFGPLPATSCCRWKQCARGNCSYWDTPTLSLAFSIPSILLKLLLKDNVDVNLGFCQWFMRSGWLSAAPAGQEPERRCYRSAPGRPGGPSSRAANMLELERDGGDKSLYNHMFSYNKIQPPLLCVQLWWMFLFGWSCALHKSVL